MTGRSSMSGIQESKGIRNLDSPAQHLDIYKKFSGLEESWEKNASACRVVKKTAQIATQSTYTEAEEKQKNKNTVDPFSRYEWRIQNLHKYTLCSSKNAVQSSRISKPKVKNARIPASSMYQINEK